VLVIFPDAGERYLGTGLFGNAGTVEKGRSK